MASLSSNLAKFAFNIYGNSQSYIPPDSPNSSLFSKEKSASNNSVYQCEREIISLTQLNDTNSVIIGGKNCLKLLTLDELDDEVINDINLLKTSNNSRSIININTIKSNLSTIVCGLSSGQLQIYNVNNNSSVSLISKLSDHKRTINSVDFVNESQIISGSQDGTIKLWDLRSNATHKPVITIQPSSMSDPLRSCQFSHHSSKSTVLSVHDSGALVKLDLRSFHHPERKWNLHSGPALSLHIHPESEYVLTGGRDQKMCVWNYGDSSPGTSRLSPEHMILTYSPVKKVRWSQTPNSEQIHYHQNDNEIDKYEDSLSDRDSYHSVNSNPLYNYDFACLYLNDDSTISIYNLNRKFIPKEIIKTPSNKPFQNFIWAKRHNSTRRIWSLTKSNNFIIYDLDNHYNQQNIKVPLQELTTVSLDWRHSIGDFAFVNQEKYEYELDDTESIFESENNDDIDQVISFENSYQDEACSKPVSFTNPSSVKPSTGSIPVAINVPYHSSSVGHSPGEKPPLLRSLTMQNVKSPSPIPQRRGSNMVGDIPANFRTGYGMTMGFDLSVRPKLSRNSSQSTMESNTSNGSLIPSTINSQRKLISVSHASPYVIPISLPLPLNDESTFESLAHNYLTSVPDGFNLIEVCHLNALAASDVDRFRDSQMWKILAISLAENIEFHERRDIIEHNTHEESILPTELNIGDNESISLTSELDNLTSSFNSNSSLRTNYGGMGANSDKNISAESLAYKKVPMSLERRNSSSHNLKDLINKSRGHSFTASPSPSKSVTVRKFFHEAENESAILDDDEDGDQRGYNGVPEIGSPQVPNCMMERKSAVHSNERSLSFKHQRSFSRSPMSQDLDNENLNFLNQAVIHSLPQSRPRAIGAGSPKIHANGVSIGSSFSNPKRGSIRTNSMVSRTESGEEWRRKSSEVPQSFNEAPSSIITTSELTKAINRNTQTENTLTKPWEIGNLLKKALEYSDNQGDIALSSTLTLLFYDKIPKVFDYLIALNSLGVYIEILQRKRLFVIAANVLKQAPKSLISELKKMNQSDTELRFFCCHCEKLLINEKSKSEMNNENVEFGYWYCDHCSRIQLNCIYCCEPCKGLAVVVSLKCGHRGHFGCLREWFINGENNECPGGCDTNIF